MSLRADGSMSWNGQVREEIVQNRLQYFLKVGLDPAKAVGADQVHGSGVYRATEADGGKGLLDRETRITGTDGLITSERGVILTTLHADCAPIFYADPEHHAIGLTHAGRRGIMAGIAGETLRRMHAEFGSEPGAVHVAVGPTICTHEYEVDAAIAAEFVARFGEQVVLRESGRAYLDLVAALTVDLLENGLNPSFIPQRPACTASNLRYSSYRRDGAPTRSMLAWLCMT